MQSLSLSTTRTLNLLSSLNHGWPLSNLSETILMNIPGVILITDLSNMILFANTSFGKLIGERSQDYVGKSLKETLSHLQGEWEFLIDEFSKSIKDSELGKHPDHRKKELDNYHHRDPLIARSTESSNFNPPSVISLKDKFFTYQIFDAGTTSAGKQMKGLILNDITEEKAFLDRMTQAENISSLKTLAAGISHEISNPLHSILSFSEALTEETDLTKIRNYAEKIVNNSSRLGKVLSDFSGYVQKKEDGAKKEVDIAMSIQSALKFAMLAYPENKIDLEEDLGSLSSLVAYPEELQQIFYNIINNACQAMKGTGLLKISARKSDQFLVITIKDNGPGMPKDILRKAFNPFFTTKMQGEGTGLGLGITQRLMQRYAGNIEIQSDEGKGTEVSLFFPIG
jgi:signal transduction histidine kinase